MLLIFRDRFLRGHAQFVAGAILSREAGFGWVVAELFNPFATWQGWLAGRGAIVRVFPVMKVSDPRRVVGKGIIAVR